MEFLHSLNNAWPFMLATVGLISLFVKWRRDRDLLSIQANAAEISRLWARIEMMENAERQQASFIDTMRSERFQLAGENQKLIFEKQRQAEEILELKKRVSALETEISQLREQKSAANVSGSDR